MSRQVQLKRGTTTQINAITGAAGEVIVDTTKQTLVVHNGMTAGGFPIAARANVDGTIELIKKDGTTAGTIHASGLFNNTLTSTNTNQAATAAQAKVLKDLVDTKLNKTDMNASGKAPLYACRSWGNFNGATGTIRASGNVLSIVSEGNGTFTINFITPMPDANYSVVSVGSDVGAGSALAPLDGTFTTSSFKVRAAYGGDNTVGTYTPVTSCFAVFR